MMHLHGLKPHKLWM